MIFAAPDQQWLRRAAQGSGGAERARAALPTLLRSSANRGGLDTQLDTRFPLVQDGRPVMVGPGMVTDSVHALEDGTGGFE